MSGQEATCDYWRLRYGQPLGTGILPFWFESAEGDWKAPSSILHDLRYDLLKPGESTQDIDREWRNNCYLLAQGDWVRRRIADIGWLIIRAYGVMR